jgi:hypothetical protein
LQDKFAAVDCVSLLSKFITVGEGTSTTVDLWRTLEVAECQSGIKACISSLRLKLRQEVRAMQRATLATNIAKKRASLETGKQGIQKAMGKGVADARMSAVETTHPSTVLVRLGWPRV